MELKIDKRLEEIVPKLKPEEYEALKKSIAEKGLLKPIDVMPDGTIVDGHHRYKACKELGIEPLYSVMPNVKTIEDALEYSFHINFPRRNLNDFQRAKWAYQVFYQQETRKAKERLARKNLSSREDRSGRVSDILAEKVGISHSTFERVKTILEQGRKEIAKLVEEEQLSIRDAYELTVALESEDAPVPEQIKEELYKRVLEAEDPAKEAEKVTKIVVNTNAVKEIMEMEDPEIAKKIKETWESKFYTEELNLDEVRDNINVWTGGTGKLIKVYLPYEKFADEENPEEAAARYFARYGGRYLDKITATVFVGEVNKYLWRKREEEEE